MPLFDYKCEKCSFKKEHFVHDDKGFKKHCPKCKSEDYNRLLSVFKIDVPVVGKYEMADKMDKDIKSLYSKIGKESLANDTKTLDNMFGTDKVKKTFYESDD
jgi:putative FmdB family regulatory protein